MIEDVMITIILFIITLFASFIVAEIDDRSGSRDGVLAKTFFIFWLAIAAGGGITFMWWLADLLEWWM